MPLTQELLTPSQVAAIFHVAIGTIYNWKYQGKLPFTKLYGALRFHPDEIERLRKQFSRSERDSPTMGMAGGGRRS